MAKLTIREAGQSTVYEILDDAVSIGRKDGMAVRLKDPHVGSEHCQIRQVPGVGYKLIDLESRNGTKVNGKFVNQHVLKNGDEIVLGEVVITFSGAAPTQAAPAVARPRPAAAPAARPAPARPAVARPSPPRAPRETRDPREPRPRRSATGSNAPIIALGVVVGLLLFGVAAVLFIGPWYQLSKNQNIFFDMKDLQKEGQFEAALSLADQADEVSDPETWGKIQKLRAEVEADIRGRDMNYAGDSAQREMWRIEKWIKNHRDDTAGIIEKWEAYIEKYRGSVWAGHGQMRLDEIRNGTGFEGSAVGAGEPAGGSPEDEPDLDTGGDAKIDRAFRSALAASKAHSDRDEFGPARDVIEDFWEKNALLAEDAEAWLERKERAISGIEDRAKARWDRIHGLAGEYVKKGEYAKAIRLYEDVKKRFGLEKYETLAKVEISKLKQ